MNRKFSDELISAFLDGELTAEEKALVEEQLMDSVEHRKMFEELRALRASLQSLPVHKLDDKFHERVLREAERAMHSAEGGDSKQDASGGPPSGQAGDADTAAAHGQPATEDASSGDTLVEPVRRSDSRRPSRGLFWTSLAVIACLLLIGVLIVFPPGDQQVADSRLDQQSPNAQNGGPAKARHAPQVTADNPPATDAVAAGEPHKSFADKRIPLAERKQAENLRRSITPGDLFEDGSQLSPSSRGVAGAGHSDLANNPTAAGEQQSLGQSANRRAAGGRAGDAAVIAQDRYELGDRDRGLRRQRALSATGQQVAAESQQTRIVKVVMSQDAYQRGLFDEELAKNQIAIDRSSDLGLHSSESGGNASKEEKNKSLPNYDDADERDRWRDEAGAFEVVMVDADPVQIESVVAGLKSLPSEQVATIDYRQPSEFSYGNDQQLGAVAGPSAPQQVSDGEANGAVDGISFARPGGNRAVSDRPRVFRGSGGFGGGGFGTSAPKDADRAKRTAPPPLADGAAPNAKATPKERPEMKRESAGPSSPLSGDKPSGGMRRANEKGDAESSQDALPKTAADLKARRDAKPESPTAAEKKHDSGKEGTAGEAAPGSPPPPSATAPVPPRHVVGEAVPESELSAAPASTAPSARAASEPTPANPQPLTNGFQDRPRIGTARRLNEKGVKELTDALGRLEQVDQARDAAMQSVMEKAASVVADLEPAAEEAAPQGDRKAPKRDEKAGKRESEALKKNAAAVDGEPTSSSTAPRPTTDSRSLKSPREEPPAPRGSVRTKPQPAGPGQNTHRLEERKEMEPARREGLAAAADGDDADGDQAERDEAATGAALRSKMAERAEAANYRRYAAAGGAPGQGRMRVLFVIEVLPNRPVQQSAETRASEVPADKAPAPAAPAK